MTKLRSFIVENPRTEAPIENKPLHSTAPLACERTEAFSVIWVVFVLAMLVDRTKRGALDDPWTLVLLVLAPFALMRPSSLLRVAMLCGAQTIYYLYAAGSLRNHQHVYIAVIFTTIVISCVLLFELFENRPPRLDELYTWVRTPSAGIALIGMFFAGLSKINSDFLDLDMSCGAIYYEWIRSNPLLSYLPGGDTGAYLGIYGGLVGELGSAFLLLFRRTRKIGLVLLWGVSLMLYMQVMSHYFEFIGLFFAMSLFYVDPQPLSRVARRVTAVRNQLERWVTSLFRGRAPKQTVPLLVIVPYGIMLAAGASGTVVTLTVYRWLCTAVLVVVVTTIFLSWWRNQTRSPATLSGDRRAWLLLIFPLLFILNESIAYLGLPHQPTLTMAGNLSLAPIGGNHLIFSKTTRFRLWPDVEIVSSNVPRWTKGVHVAWPRFSDILSYRPHAKVTYRMEGGPLIEIKEAGLDSRFKHHPMSRLLGLRDYRVRRGYIACGKPLPNLSVAKTERRARKRRAARVANGLAGEEPTPGRHHDQVAPINKNSSPPRSHAGQRKMHRHKPTTFGPHKSVHGKHIPDETSVTD